MPNNICLRLFTIFLLFISLNFYITEENIFVWTREGEFSSSQKIKINGSDKLDNFKRINKLDYKNFDFPFDEKKKTNNIGTRVFYENIGQFHKEIYYYADIIGGRLSFGQSLVNFAIEGQIIQVTFPGSNKVIPEGKNFLRSYSNYFYRTRVYTQVRHYQKITFKDLYKDISLVYKFTQQGLKYDFIVEPYARIDQLQMKFQGIDTINIEPTTLSLTVANVTLYDTGLQAWEESTNRTVPIRFSTNTLIDSNNLEKRNSQATIQFIMEQPYNSSKRIIIDPLICTYSTYLGGSDTEITDRVRFGMDVDNKDNVVVTGSTASVNFPTKNAYQKNHNGSHDAFISKFSSNGSLLFSTYIGGEDDDFGTDVVIDSEGNIIIAGCTNSHNFPITSNAYQKSRGGAQDVFLTKFNSSGYLLASTYLGGSDSEWTYGVTVDANGEIIVGGETFSTDMPLQNPYQSTYSGLGDTYVTKFCINLQTVIFSTYLGGNQNEWWVGVAVDLSGNIILNGASWSKNFPTTKNAIQESLNGDFADTFVTKFNPDGQILVFSTFLGGENFDMGLGATVDNEGYIAVTGETLDDFPVLNAYQQKSRNDPSDSSAYVTKLNANGNIVFSTYLGGQGESMGYDVAFDVNGNLIVVGETTSTTFPVVDAYQEEKGGNFDSDAFITAFNASGSVLFSTYLGGNQNDGARSVAADSSGHIITVGWTKSTDFLSVNASQENHSGEEDIFLCSFNTGNLENYIADPGDITSNKPSSRSTSFSQLFLPLVIVVIVQKFWKKKFQNKNK